MWRNKKYYIFSSSFDVKKVLEKKKLKNFQKTYLQIGKLMI